MTIHRTADGGFRLEGDVDHTLQLIFAGAGDCRRIQ